jgi:hypothetical protein
VKKGILLLLFTGLIGCSDGELQIETIDFDEVPLNFCGSATTQTELLFKLKQFDALILDLEAGLIRNEASADTLRSSIPGGSQVRYRLFDGAISASYFCDAVPPVSPKVVEEIPAEAGEVLIFTTRSETDTTQFEHIIRLKDVSFVNEAGERLTNIAVEEFGSFTTSQD